MNVIILIPALNPDVKFAEYVGSLSREDFRHIVVVNDGSDKEFEPIFEEISKKENCTVICHEVNKGKGRSLKFGMKYVMENYHDCVGIVTADADGQHRLTDIIRVANALEENDNRLILGSRDFTSGDIPARSSFGNKLTSKVFALMFGQKLMDTQTGLRGIPLKIIPQILKISGERFEYEMNMLIECRRKNIEIFEIPIQTIYIDENSSSHFRPVVDSVKVYLLIFKGFFSFVISSFACTIIDLCIYALLVKLIIPQSVESRIIIATVIARVISSVANFIVNKNLVFHKKGGLLSSAIKYYVLVLVQMLISANVVNWIFGLMQFGEVLIKVIVDVTLFFVNYFIQKKLIFRDNIQKNSAQ